MSDFSTTWTQWATRDARKTEQVRPIARLGFFKDTELIRQQIALKHRYRIRKHYNNRQHKDKKQHDKNWN